MRGRFAAGLVIVALLLSPTARATTASSLSGRIVIDGVLDEYASDEWVLDSSSYPRESNHDSRWGTDDDISRVALTWDRNFLYVAVEGRAFDSLISLFISNRAGGLMSLEDAGDFRRAIDLSALPVNVFALAAPGRVPDVARADDSHPFALVDRSAIPAAMAGVRTGPVGFEIAVPWSMLTLAAPVKLVAAVTGETGSGAGDAAPDASSALDDDRFARAVLDRWFEINADVDHDGLADIGISPDLAGLVRPDFAPEQARGDASVELFVPRRAFAPERGESARIDMVVKADAYVFVSAAVFSLEGERVHTFLEDESLASAWDIPLFWDGRDAHGDMVRGGTYVVVVDWGFNRGEHSGRAKTAVVVAR